MHVSEIIAGKPISTVELIISEIGTIRENKAGKTRNCRCYDTSGDIEVVLWNEDTEKYKLNDIISITKGWCNAYNGKLQVSAGKFGKIEKIGEKKVEEPIKASTDTGYTCVIQTVVENHLRPTISTIRGRYKEETCWILAEKLQEKAEKSPETAIPSEKTIPPKIEPKQVTLF